MKIVFFSAAKSYGGGERYLTTLLPLLSKRGYDVSLVADAPEIFVGLTAGVGKYCPDHYNVAVFNGNGALYRWGSVVSKHNTKRVFVMHSSLYDAQEQFYKRLLRPLVLKWHMKYVDLLVRVSKSCLPDAFHHNLHTIYNGVPLGTKIKSVRRDSGPLKLAIVGTLNENKNQLLAIRSLCELPTNITLIIIGSGPAKEALEDFVTRKSLADRVAFLGFVDDPVQILSQCHALLMPSIIEAFPFAALEAMSIGLPVISSKTGGLTELIHDGVNGLLFDINDKEELIKKIMAVYREEHRRSQLADQAWETIANKYSENHMVQKLEDALLRNCAEP